MAITINGTGTITGISQGGLNDNIITKNEMATGGAWAPAGTVLQVVQGTLTTTPAISSTSFVTTGLAASITPTSSTSKILILYSSAAYLSGSTVSGMTAIYRNSTNLSGSNGFMQNYAASSGAQWTNQSFTYLDSPATASSVTYTIYARVTTGSMQFGNDPSGNTESTITLMEIAV